MKDVAIVADRLRRLVIEVEDRIHLQEADLNIENRLADDEGIDWTSEAGLRAIASSFRSESLPVFTPTPNGERLLGFLGPRNLRQAGSDPRELAPTTIAVLSALIGLIRRGREALLALSIRVRAAEALKLLTAKPKSPVVGNDAVSPKRDEQPFKTRLDAFRDALLATTQRAVDVNGVVSRPAETLISSLVELEPGREGGRRGYKKSQVPNGFISQLAVAMEVAGQDFALVMGDHFEVFWRTEALPAIAKDLDKVGVAGPELSAQAVRNSFPTGDSNTAAASEPSSAGQLREAIHKACDDFALRMRTGGVSALSIAMPPPVSGLDLIKSAVRYPMQFVFLLSYIALPIVAVVGFSSDASSAAVLKGFIPLILPLLLIFAIAQARSIRQAAAEAALESARRQLRAEASKTAREIGDAISATWRGFLSAVEKRVAADVIGAAEAIRKSDQQRDEAERELERTAIESRLKGLADLQSGLQSSLKDATKAVADALENLAKPPRSSRLRNTAAAGTATPGQSAPQANPARAAGAQS